MYDALFHDLERGQVQQLQLLHDGRAMTARSVIQCWREDIEFVDEFCDLLSQCHFDVFRWETPAVTEATLDREFEFVLLRAPDLGNREPDRHSFAKQLSSCSQEHPVATFRNLGGDALMVVPAGLVNNSAYTDLASFSRGAPRVQQRAFWRSVGEAMDSEVGDSPVWLSTAGGGVAWLHVRLDSRPKYYAHAPYREKPDA